MKLTWITDVHLNFLEKDERIDFYHTLKANHDKSSKVLASAWGQQVSPSAIIRLLHKLGYSYKKHFIIPKGILECGMNLLKR